MLGKGSYWEYKSRCVLHRLLGMSIIIYVADAAGKWLFQTSMYIFNLTFSSFHKETIIFCALKYYYVFENLFPYNNFYFIQFVVK